MKAVDSEEWKEKDGEMVKKVNEYINFVELNGLSDLQKKILHGAKSADIRELSPEEREDILQKIFEGVCCISLVNEYIGLVGFHGLSALQKEILYFAHSTFLTHVYVHTE